MKSFSKRVGESFGSFLIKHRIKFLIAVVAVTIFFANHLKSIKFDSSNEAYLPKGDKQVEINNQFKETFGNEEFIYLLIRKNSDFTVNDLDQIDQLQETILKKLPFAKDVQSVTRSEMLINEYDELVSYIPYEEGIETYIEAKELLSKYQESEIYGDKIINSTSRALGIQITFDEIPKKVWVERGSSFSPLSQANLPADEVVMAEDIKFQDGENLTAVDDPRKLLSPAINAIVKGFDNEDIEISITGLSVLDFEMDRFTSEEGAFFGLLAMIIAAVFLIILFRSFRALISPILVVILTFIQLFGFLAFVGIPLSLSSLILAPLLLIISVSYSIHIIKQYKRIYTDKVGVQNAVIGALEESFWPCFLTALTTAVGFLSFLAVPMKPIRYLGISAAVGVFITFILVMIIVPILLSVSKKPIKGSLVKFKKVTGWTALSGFVQKRALPILIVFAIIAGFGVYYGRKLTVQTDFIQMMGEKVSFVKETQEITDVMGAVYSYEVLIELPEEDMAKNPEVLNKLEDLTNRVEDYSSVKMTTSFVDIIKYLNSVLNEDYSIPKTKELIAGYIILYEMAGGEELNQWTDYDFKTLRLSVQLGLSKDVESQIKEVKAYAETLFPEGTIITMVGDVPVMTRMMTLLAKGQAYSILIAAGVIALFMILVLTSLKGGLVSILPNIFPLFAMAGVMGVLGVSLDMITVMIAPMIIGIAVDDTVHFFLHFKESLKEKGNYARGVEDTYDKVGGALLFTSLILISGFAVFLFSDAGSLIHFGLLAAVGIFSALAADMLLTPALLHIFKPFKTKKK